MATETKRTNFALNMQPGRKLLLRSLALWLVFLPLLISFGVAVSGMSGNATRPKLHFEVRKNATPVNPMTYLE